MARASLDLQLIPYSSIAGGVRFDVDPLDLDPTQSPSSTNFEHRRGTLRLRKGIRQYRDFSDAVPSADREHPWTVCRQFSFDDGDSHLVVASSSKIYTFDGSAWTDRTGSLTLSGSDFVPWDFEFGTDDHLGANGTAFLVNGADNILYWDGTTASFVDITTSSTWDGPGTDIHPRYIAQYEGRLVVAHIEETATGIHHARVRFSQVSQFDVFNPVNGGHAYDLLETPGEITGLARLGDVLYVLKSDAIFICQGTGDPMAPFIFPSWIDRGCIAGRSFRAIDPFTAIYLGQDNIYVLRGQDAQPIGDAIRDDVYANIDYRRLNLVEAYVFEEEHVYRLWIPVRGENFASKCYAYDWQEQRWWVEEWPSYCTAVGYTTLGQGTLIDDLTNTIDSYTDPIDDWGPDASGITQLVCGGKEGDWRVYRLDRQGYDDIDGTQRSIDAWWESKDFMLSPGEDLTLRRIDIHYRSQEDVKLAVRVSTDRGQTWTTHSANVSKGVGIVSTWWNLYGPYFRVRLEIASSMEGESVSGAHVELVGIEARVLQRARRH